jgi:hypothetical protein
MASGLRITMLEASTVPPVFEEQLERRHAAGD